MREAHDGQKKPAISPCPSKEGLALNVASKKPGSALKLIIAGMTRTAAGDDLKE
jgi:ribosomal protein S12